MATKPSVSFQWFTKSTSVTEFRDQESISLPVKTHPTHRLLMHLLPVCCSLLPLPTHCPFPTPPSNRSPEPLLHLLHGVPVENLCCTPHSLTIVVWIETVGKVGRREQMKQQVNRCLLHLSDRDMEVMATSEMDATVH